MANAPLQILLIDDEQAICEDISRILIREGFTVAYRTSGETALEYLETGPGVDVVALDINMGAGMNGVECLKQIKAKYKYIQVIMVTGEQDFDTGIECMRNGAFDYIKKPFNKQLFLEKALKAWEKKKSLIKEEAEQRRTQDAVMHDALTDLFNRRYFDNYIEECGKNGRLNSSALCMLLLDIDHFKKFNDTYGHSMGDAVLKHVAKLLKDAVRGSDFVARYGGEEFVIVLHDIVLANGIKVAEKIRSSVEKTPLIYFDGKSTQSLSATISAGAAKLKGSDYTNLIKRADQALYKAKSAGRNRVESEAE